jgi:hypothetical protein
MLDNRNTVVITMRGEWKPSAESRTLVARGWQH